MRSGRGNLGVKSVIRRASLRLVPAPFAATMPPGISLRAFSQSHPFHSGRHPREKMRLRHLRCARIVHGQGHEEFDPGPPLAVLRMLVSALRALPSRLSVNPA